MQQWLADHPLISYVLIFAMVSFVFNKVFRTQKLPILKDVIIYLMIALGSFMLLVFQIDKLPIVQSLGVAIALMFMVRIRYFIEGRRKKQRANSAQD
ncbi:YlaH-like family protein [Paenibacillus marinisediminis]